MRFFQIKSSNSIPKPTTDASDMQAEPAPEKTEAKVSLGDMPPEIAAAIFGAIDVRDTVGLKSYANLRATCRDLQAIGNDLMLRAITPYKEEADTDMASLREQASSAWLDEDEHQDLHLLKRHLHTEAQDRKSRRSREHKAFEINLHSQVLKCSAFSPSGRYLAIGDAVGFVSLVDMQSVKKVSQNEEGRQVIDYESPAVEGLRDRAGCIAAAITFSADDTRMALAYCEVEDDYPNSDWSLWSVVVYDITGARPCEINYALMPKVVDNISSIALDARGKTLVVGVENRQTLVRVDLSPPLPEHLYGEVSLTYIPLGYKTNGQVAYSTRGTLMCDAIDGEHREVAKLQTPGLRGGRRRPFAMPRPSQLKQRLSSDDASEDAHTQLTLTSRAQRPELQLRTHVDGTAPYVRTQAVAWNHDHTPSVLFAPGNRHALVTASDSYQATLVDFAPPASLEEMDDELQAMIDAEAVSQLAPESFAAPHRRMPFRSRLPGKHTLQRKFNKLTRRGG